MWVCLPYCAFVILVGFTIPHVSFRVLLREREGQVVSVLSVYPGVWCVSVSTVNSICY